MSPDPVTFQIFLSFWNGTQGQVTPRIHFDMAVWLENAVMAGERRLLLQAFRSAGKSTITGLFCAWLLCRDPDTRIMVLAADMVLARKMVRNVRKIIERHPLTQDLKPERADQWASDRFTVRRRLELRDPSMLARGIDTNVTGSRADVIICDDVEVPNTCDTAEKRRSLRENLAETEFVLTPGGLMLYIGTPHSWYTIYAAEAREETGEERPFLDGFSRLTLPVINDRGESAWPERYSLDDIERMKRAAGPHRFATQMLLRPGNITEGRLDPANLRFYASQPQQSAALGGLYIEGKKIVSTAAWWDPSFNGGRDASVFAVVYTTEDGAYYLHRVEYLKLDPFSGETEAEQQTRKVAFIAQLLRVTSITVETNGLGQFLPAALRKALARNNVACAIVPVHNTKPKDLRILEAFDAILAARMLYVHDSVKTTPFIAEMQEWKPGRRGQRDDGLDAVAGALSRSPVRLPYERTSGRKAHTANSAFEV